MVGNIKIKGSGILCLILFFGLSALQCKDDETPQFQDIIFLLDFEINPSDSLIKKNDTLWITSEFSDNIFEYNSNSSIKISDFNFQNTIGFFRLTGKDKLLSDQPGALESFQFVNLIGSVSVPRETFANFNLSYSNGMYSCRIGLIPKSKGVYSINFLSPANLDLTNSVILPDAPDGRKTLPAYRNIYYVINDGRTNFDLYKKHCVASSEIVATPPLIFYEQKGTFTFRVTD